MRILRDGVGCALIVDVWLEHDPFDMTYLVDVSRHMSNYDILSMFTCSWILTCYDILFSALNVLLSIQSNSREKSWSSDIS